VRTSALGEPVPRLLYVICVPPHRQGVPGPFLEVVAPLT